MSDDAERSADAAFLDCCALSEECRAATERRDAAQVELRVAEQALVEVRRKLAWALSGLESALDRKAGQ